MPRNGSGTYVPPTNSWSPAVNAVSATVSDYNVLLNDYVAVFTQSISKDGQTTYTGNQPMGGFKLTGLGAGTADGDSIRWQQIFNASGFVAPSVVYQGYTENVYNIGSVSSTTLDYANGAVQKLATTGNLTVTLPAASAGKTIVLWILYGGTHTVTFAGGTLIKYVNGAVPTATSTNAKWDKYIISCVDTAFTSVGDGGRNI